MWILILISLVVFPSLGRKPPAPNYEKPVCYSEPCTKRIIKAKIYVEDTLWDNMSDLVGQDDPGFVIRKQLDNTFSKVNKLLGELDNGGYRVEYVRNVTKLGASNIKLKDTYVDRINGNKTKKVDINNIFSHTFTFQEAVQKLPGRRNVDLRILIIPERRGGGPTLATAEETCICNYNWFGCIAVFSIRKLNDWTFHSTIFAHEIGHALGMDLHDDSFYENNPGNKLIMWSEVGSNANIWSPEAKRRINRQDNSCLKRRDKSAIIFPDE